MGHDYANRMSSPGTQEALALLQCPLCAGSFQTQGLIYDVLRCRCGEYPMVFGIPVLMRGPVGSSGWTAQQVIESIRAGKYRQALEGLLLPPLPRPSDLTRRLTEQLSSMRIVWRLNRCLDQRRLQSWKSRAHRFVDKAVGGELSAAEFLEFYFCKSGLNLKSVASYFIYKFLQPRNMVALSLAETLQNSDGPILDLCCGGGHICFGLEQRFPKRLVIGLDRSFPMLFVARNWSAKKCFFVCCDLDSKFPFRSAAFGGVVCNDAFHYFQDKASIASECWRILDERAVLVLQHVRTSFSEVDLNYLPLKPMEYGELMTNVPHAMIRDLSVMATYLQGLGPDLSASEPEAAQAPIVSLVASRNPEVFRAYGKFEQWPHGRGSLIVNPLYHSVADDSGRDILELRYPSAPDPSMSLKNEHERYELRLEERLAAEDLEGMAEDDLVKRFILLAAPEYFYRSDPVSHRPRKVTRLRSSGVSVGASQPHPSAFRRCSECS